MADSKSKTVPVTILKSLGAQAPKFDITIPLTLLDGTQASLVLHCKAMLKTEWAAARDAHQADLLASFAPVAAPEAAEGEEVTSMPAAVFQDNVESGLDRDAELVARFATGWELSDDFSVENLRALENNFGGSLSAAIEAYGRAIFQGRLGN